MTDKLDIAPTSRKDGSNRSNSVEEQIEINNWLAAECFDCKQERLWHRLKLWSCGEFKESEQ